ncbi:BTAD domain-containing putative transcriptional regulator [Micromonospora sp. WMMD882]|uniref:BTAD domain-containing putative transcriptional regulator n=1 Tax=Micromonospora sp. WMMD882 TaxID=3015151 RepID=UPI00248BABBD|nr:BTAD domain-containing putative transcriptional regulator [Micromonospora sp. WMMD882]WBB80466.1 BTAD domain-containing putative transcriptional regulator [Micromonospora sp. WMMD882]
MPTTPDDRLRVSVLGPVRAWHGDRELPLGPTRQRVLFALLAMAVGRDVGRDDLVAGVWGPTPPPTATGNLYTYVSGLRRSLGRGALTSGPAGYALRLRPEDLDSERFATLCAEAARLRGGGDHVTAVARLDEALGLWHGEAYAGLAGHRLDAERTRLARSQLDAVEQRARTLIELGDDGVLADLVGLVRDHPLHEPLHELLMLALYRRGRHREALGVYHRVRESLRSELGVEPAAGLTRLYGIVAATADARGGRDDGADALDSRGGRADALDSRGGRAATGGGRDGRADALDSGGRPARPAREGRPGHADPASEPLPGRGEEARRLRGLLTALAAGQGTAVWVEGEAGIGKSALLAAAFADAAASGCQVARGAVRDEDRHVPLPALTRALELPVDHAGSGPGRSDDSAVAATTDLVLARVREVCATAPLLLVVDGLPTADPSGAPCWERLVAATRRLPLLLVAAARPEPNDPELGRLRRAVAGRRGHLLPLDALPAEVVERLVTDLVGAPLGPNLAEVVVVSAGNPRYAHELTAALLRRGEIRVVDGVADISDPARIEAPRTLLATIRATMDPLSADAQEVLRTAALLGVRFSVEDVRAVTGRSPVDLVASLEEALAARVVVDVDTDLAFRHPLLRQVLYDSIPAAARAALHRHTAEVLADGGSPVGRVAEQLLAAPSAVDHWVTSWLVARHGTLARRAPRVAGTLLRRVLAADLTTPQERVRLLVALVRLDFRDERQPLDEAREALRLAVDPADRAEIRHLLALLTHRAGDVAAALDILREALAEPGVPGFWRNRHRMLLATFLRGPLDDLDRADRTAAAAHAVALAANQPYDAVFALRVTWLTNTVRRDHERALKHVDRALDVMRDHPAFAGLYLDLLDNRVFTLQNLDRPEEAERTLREAALFALRHRLPSGLHVASAVGHYWSGRWDDVLSVVGAVTDDLPGATLLGMREPAAVAALLHGVAALVAARRDDDVLAGGHLDAPELWPATEAERECGDFLLVARALVAERQGRPERALHLLDPLLTPEYAPVMLRHQWLPDVVRLALRVGQRDLAERAAAVCADEAAREVRAARARPAAQRCRALLTGDPEPALAAAARYRAVGRVTELAAALEDAAVLLAARRRPHEAARAGGEAAQRYAVLGARWDLRRLTRRLAGYGVDPSPSRALAGRADP